LSAEFQSSEEEEEEEVLTLNIKSKSRNQTQIAKKEAVRPDKVMIEDTRRANETSINKCFQIDSEMAPPPPVVSAFSCQKLKSKLKKQSVEKKRRKIHESIASDTQQKRHKREQDTKCERIQRSRGLTEEESIP
jgi:hypothetical protein